MAANDVLNDRARELFDPFAFGLLSTTNPDGSPQVSLVAGFLDGDGPAARIVVFHRGWYQKLRNIGRTPQVAFTVLVPPAPGEPIGMLPYLVVHGVAEVHEGDAGPWAERLAAARAASFPVGVVPPPLPTLPPNGGWTTRITPVRVGGVGPWHD